MTLDAALTLATIAGCFGCLVFTRWPADAVLLAGAAVLMVTGVLPVSAALEGFANEGVATVGVLYIVAQGLYSTGAVSWLSQGMLGRPRSLMVAQARLMIPVAVFSSVLNNTPVVAMMVPVVSDWARRMQYPASQLMMPLSFAAIIGGVCTLIGTSTNLVINGMLNRVAPQNALSLFDLAWVGIPCVIVVLLFVVLFARRLLPYRLGTARRFEDARQYIVEMIVAPGSVVAGRSIEDAGLRHLPGLYLAEIIRDDRLIPAVSPTEVLLANDRLVFAGNVDAVIELKKLSGLRSAEDQVFKLDGGDSERSLVEVVISQDFPLLGKTVREGNFRNYYNAVIIAVSRNGQQLKQRIGDLELKPGDTLLLEASADFLPKQRFSRDFLVVSSVAHFRPIQDRKRWVAVGILLAMLVVVGTGLLSMFKASIIAAIAMVVTGCISLEAARRSVSWQVLAAIAASLALGRAMQDSGLAMSIAHSLVATAAGSAYGTLAVVFLLTAGFSAVITNVAAAVLMFPVAYAAAGDIGANIIPFAVTIMVAASASFSTPIGYQTNLMVYGPGDYQFADFLRMGIPLTLLVGAVTVAVVPLVWPLFS